jgi:hypothetical protein
MHDVDRTQQFLEAGYPSQETYGLETLPGEYGGTFESGSYEAAPQFEYAPAGEVYGEVYGEVANYETLRDPLTGEVNSDMEIALAAELLSVTNDRELDHFFGKFIRGLGRTFGKFAKSGAGKALFGALRPLAKAALPTLGGALGSLIPIPGVGTAVGAAAAGALGNAIGLEFQGMSGEDRDLEIARRIIRTGIETAQQVEASPQGELASEGEVWDAIKGLASRALPGAVSLLTSGVSGGATAGSQGTGGLSGGAHLRLPFGIEFDAAGQAGGQVTSGAAVGLNAPVPNVPFQPSPANQVMPYPYQSGAGGVGPAGWRPGPRPPARPGPRPFCPPGMRAQGRWIRRGRAIIVLGLC